MPQKPRKFTRNIKKGSPNENNSLNANKCKGKIFHFFDTRNGT